jgi:hypothetical protein
MKGFAWKKKIFTYGAMKRGMLYRQPLQCRVFEKEL